MSSKRKREKEDSSKHKRNKKARAAASKQAEEGSDGPSATEETALTTIDGTSEERHNLMENGYETDIHQLYSQSEQRWQVRGSVGGRLLDHAPVFSNDGQYYILAYVSGVKVFSCETSLMVRLLPCAADAPIISISISPSEPASLIVGFANGRIERWTWMTGTRTAGFEIDSPISAVAVASFQDTNRAEDIVYVSFKANETWDIAAYAFGDEDDQQQDENSRTLWSSQTRIETLQTCENGRFLVASDKHRIVIGTQQGSEISSLKSASYSWKEISFTDTISCLKTHISTKRTAKHPPVLDLAVGTRQGIIYLYRNIINQLEVAKSSRNLPPVSRLHWHRAAVATVDWSRDGNYLISGGVETVLVMWQLNSNQKSFLPHLTAPILKAVVSPSGESYGITLADNSSMVLQTLTLEPETSIAEPQLFLTGDADRIASKGHSSTVANLDRWRMPMSVTNHSSRLLYVTSVSPFPREGGSASSSSPFLHTYDYKSGAQISKQAVARTLVTDRKSGPKGENIQEPKVVLLQVSANEKWLATVDEWQPASEKLSSSGPLAAHIRNVRRDMLESNLRFWSWNDSKSTWEMVWRTELSRSQPFDSGSSKIILDLAAGPNETRFYSLDEDYTVKMWYPTQRLRSGIRVKDGENRDLSNWTSQQLGVLPAPPNRYENLPLSGRVAISRDGSLLLASISLATGGVVGTFDTRSGELLSTHFDKTDGPIRGLGIVGSCAVALSDNFAAWDLVDTTRQHKAALGNPGAKRATTRPYFQIACDAERQTCAIVCPTIDQHSLLTILTGDGLQPVASISLPFLVTALIPAPAQRGFLAINPNSEITLIASSGSDYMAQSLEEQRGSASLHTRLDQVFGNISLDQPLSTAPLRDQERSMFDEGALITTDSNVPQLQSKSGEIDPLRRIFDANQPLSSPGVLSTFKQVASALSKQSKLSA